jgi:TM2 domain-containing membrane protein YozV
VLHGLGCLVLGCVVLGFVALLCCWVGWLSFVSVVSWIWFALAGYNHTVLYSNCNILTCVLHWDTLAESVAGV